MSESIRLSHLRLFLSERGRRKDDFSIDEITYLIGLMTGSPSLKEYFYNHTGGLTLRLKPFQVGELAPVVKRLFGLGGFSADEMKQMINLEEIQMSNVSFFHGPKNLREYLSYEWEENLKAVPNDIKLVIANLMEIPQVTSLRFPNIKHLKTVKITRPFSRLEFDFTGLGEVFPNLETLDFAKIHSAKGDIPRPIFDIQFLKGLKKLKGHKEYYKEMD